MSENESIERIDAYCDAAPRQWANAESTGTLVLFIPSGPGWPYYARPRLGRSPGELISVADVRAVRARQRELLIPESFEWIEQAAPDMAAAAAGAGLEVRRHPLMLLDTLVPPPALPPRISVRVFAPDDPDVILAWAVPGVAFAHPGTAIGDAGVTERDKMATDHDASTITLLREKLETGVSVLAAACGPNGPWRPAASSWPVASPRSPGSACCPRAAAAGSAPPSRRRWLPTRSPVARESCSCPRPTTRSPASTRGWAFAESASR